MPPPGSDALRQELRPWGLHVALIQPGSIKTPIFEKSNAHADELLERMPKRGRELYAPHIDAVRSFATRSAAQAIPPERVAEAVAHALTARRPRTRYLVGTDARVQAALQALLPDRWRDAFVARFLGLPGPGRGPSDPEARAAAPQSSWKANE